MKKQLTRDKVLKIIQANGCSKERLLSILLEIQQASGHNSVDEEWAQLVAEQVQMPITQLYNVLTFYAMFSTKQRGKFVIEICKSTPCHVTKSDEIVKMFGDELGIGISETTPDNLFTLMHTGCVGACDIGPVAKIGEQVYGNLTRKKVADIVASYREVEQHGYDTAANLL
ncbi:MAG: hndA [Firmicutes bacterium]|nr:hndA [Bacillota bacterium]